MTTILGDLLPVANAPRDVGAIMSDVIGALVRKHQAKPPSQFHSDFSAEKTRIFDAFYQRPQTWSKEVGLDPAELHDARILNYMNELRSSMQTGGRSAPNTARPQAIPSEIYRPGGGGGGRVSLFSGGSGSLFDGAVNSVTKNTVGRTPLG